MNGSGVECMGSADGVSMEDFFDDKDACPSRGIWGMVKAPWELVNAEKQGLNALEKQKEGAISPGAELHESVVVKGKVAVGAGTVIDPFVVLEGPLVIGEKCEVRSGAWIRPGTVVGNECVIGHGVELKNTLMFNEAKIGTNCFVGDSVLGKGARVGSGTIIGNRRFDQKVIGIKIGDEKHSTGTDKFGAILGEYSRLGANVVTNPGTLVKKHGWVLSGVVLRGLEEKVLMDERARHLIRLEKAMKLSKTDMKGKV